jgi:hypothetical protein
VGAGSAGAPRDATLILVYLLAISVYLVDNVRVCLKPNVQHVSIDATKGGPGG